MDLFRIWIIGSAVLFGGFMVYEFAPILIPLAAVTLVLGAVVAAITWLTRRYRKPDLEPGEKP